MLNSQCSCPCWGILSYLSLNIHSTVHAYAHCHFDREHTLWVCKDLSVDGLVVEEVPIDAATDGGAE